jgi:hypothetical protein
VADDQGNLKEVRTGTILRCQTAADPFDDGTGLDPRTPYTSEAKVTDGTGEVVDIAIEDDIAASNLGRVHVASSFVVSSDFVWEPTFLKYRLFYPLIQIHAWHNLRVLAPISEDQEFYRWLVFSSLGSARTFEEHQYSFR